MVPVLLITLLAALVAGILLAILGWRGQRLNDHPVCSWCHFDLDGVYPESVTCPECGAGLKRENAVRIGVRQRRPVVMLAGILMALTSLVPFGVVGYAAITGGDINKYKPLGLLLWEARHSDALRAGKLADEIMTRILKGEIDKEEYQRIIAAVLEYQGDLSREWSENWGELVERARFDGVLKVEDAERFERQAAVIELETRALTQPGAELPIMLKLKETRVGLSSFMPCNVSLKGATLGGKRIELPQVARQRDVFIEMFGQRGGRVGGEGLPLGSMALSGSKSAGRSVFATGSNFEPALLLKAPEDAGKGVQTLELELQVTQLKPGRGPFLDLERGKPRAAKTSATVEVRGKDEPVLTAKGVTPEQKAALMEKLRPQSITRDGMLGGTLITMNGVIQNDGRMGVAFECKDLPVPVSYDVYMRRDGEEVYLGSFASERPVDQPAQPAMSMQSVFTITINGVTTTRSESNSGGEEMRRVVTDRIPADAAEVDLVLKPSPRGGMKSLTQKEYANEELVFEGVPVEQDPMEQMRQRMNQQFRMRGR